MKEIKAFILHEFLETVINHLESAGAKDITVTKVDAVGNLADLEQDRIHIIRKYREKYSTLIKLEVVCSDQDADIYIDIIKKNAHSGSRADGRIFLYDVLQTINIQTGAEGNEAL